MKNKVFPNRSEKRFYIYIYRDLNNLPIYVGKGTRSRWLDHLKSKYLIGNKLRKLLKNGIQLIPEIIFAIDEDHAFFLEKCLISIFGRRDNKTGTLYNLTDGGEGIYGSIVSEEVRVKMGNSRRGRTHTLETKEKLSACKLGDLNPNYGKKLPVETCRKMSEGKRGINNGMAGGRNVFILGEGRFVDMGVSGRYCLNSNFLVEDHTNIIAVSKFTQLTVPPPKYKCPHCNTMSVRGNLNRWHLDNCKLNLAKNKTRLK